MCNDKTTNLFLAEWSMEVIDLIWQKCQKAHCEQWLVGPGDECLQGALRKSFGWIAWRSNNVSGFVHCPYCAVQTCSSSRENILRKVTLALLVLICSGSAVLAQMPPKRIVETGQVPGKLDSPAEDNTSKLLSAQTDAIRSLSAKVDALEARLAAVEAKVKK